MTPKIYAGFAFRYEPDWLVEELKENLAWVDGFAAYDDRSNPAVWSPAKERNQKVFDLAVEAGADWVLFTAPDERWSPNTEPAVRAAVESLPACRFTFPLREMWSPTEYRVDGVWGQKYRVRLTRPGVKTRPKPVPIQDVNIYHLKMIEAENRKRRVAVFKEYNRWDNKARGFDYLADERGLRLETIPDGLMYTPPYKTYEFSVPGFE